MRYQELAGGLTLTQFAVATASGRRVRTVLEFAAYRTQRCASSENVTQRGLAY